MPCTFFDGGRHLHKCRKHCPSHDIFETREFQMVKRRPHLPQMLRSGFRPVIIPVQYVVNFGSKMLDVEQDPAPSEGPQGYPRVDRVRL